MKSLTLQKVWMFQLTMRSGCPACADRSLRRAVTQLANRVPGCSHIQAQKLSQEHGALRTLQSRPASDGTEEVL